METAVYQIKLKDSRTFRVFCANKTQKNKVIAKCNKLKEKIELFEQLTNGIHNVNDFMAHSTTF